MKCIELPYQSDSSQLFSVMAHLRGAIFLDSGHGDSQGRFDIFSAEPYVRIYQDKGRTYCERQGQHELQEGEALAILRSYLQPVTEPVPGLPFCGGAMGYMAYDFASAFDLPVQAAHTDHSSFDMGIYDWAVVVDHQQQKSYWVCQERDPYSYRQWKKWHALWMGQAKVEQHTQCFELATALQAELSKQAYQKAFQRIKAYLYAGDCYQTNFTYCFSAQAHGNPWPAYQRIRQHSPAPFSAFLNLAHGAVLSFSPERFLQLQQGLVTTSPIKGTRPCSDDAQHNARMIQDLKTNAKDRSENSMIVDLLRNDISQVCQFGSVKVTELLAVKRFAGVHHLISSIQAKLNKDKDALHLWAATFPGGSITGAPKKRSMQIIQELEQDARNIYCGSIAYIGFDGHMDSNIVIRSLVYSKRQQRLELRVGGGIVVESEVEAEYQETLDKVAVIRAALMPFVKTKS